MKTIGADSRTRIVPERHPAWSPDGRMVAFLHDKWADPMSSIILVPATGGQETNVAELNYGAKLVWSPDGRWHLSTEWKGKWPAIVAGPVSSRKKHYLTEPFEFRYNGFGLSPDLGRLILSLGGPGATAVLETRLDRSLAPVGQPRTLIPKLAIRQMVVTSDAKEILYTDGAEEEGIGLWRCHLSPGATPVLIHATADRYSTRTGSSEIWIAGREGANPRRLTFTNARTSATPRWSPDGVWIAFESNETGQTDVYVIRSNGGPVHRLTNHAASDAIPNWSRDGRTIYFCSNRTGRFEIWKTPAFGGAVEQVTRQRGFTAVESHDGRAL